MGAIRASPVESSEGPWLKKLKVGGSVAMDDRVGPVAAQLVPVGVGLVAEVAGARSRSRLSFLRLTDPNVLPSTPLWPVEATPVRAWHALDRAAFRVLKRNCRHTDRRRARV